MGELGIPFKEIGDLVPSVYYDLIARVSSGFPLVALILYEHKPAVQVLKELVGGGGIALVVLMMSYLVGILLTPLGNILDLLVRIAWKNHHGLSECSVIKFDEKLALQREQIDGMDKDAGRTLAKMLAEKTLSQNILASFLVFRTFDKLQLYSHHVPEICVLAILALISGLYRGIAYLGRHQSIYNHFFPTNQQR